MKKQTAIKKADGVRKLAHLLGISTQAVYKWPADVPEFSLSCLKRMRPEWFAKEKK